MLDKYLRMSLDIRGSTGMVDLCGLTLIDGWFEELKRNEDVRMETTNCSVSLSSFMPIPCKGLVDQSKQIWMDSHNGHVTRRAHW
ncbi:unnamed protein product [Allacma fusca]|uniref:Uncharacterized protein n=1 Tax=Allacma fusca TaxID=39272 RepID=A0A8J2L9F8_9HEXA|nr:unnamed protein product [Allacma fusca]